MICLPSSGGEIERNLTKSAVLFSAEYCRLNSTVAPRGLSKICCDVTIILNCGVDLDKIKGPRAYPLSIKFPRPLNRVELTSKWSQKVLLISCLCILVTFPQFLFSHLR